MKCIKLKTDGEYWPDYNHFRRTCFSEGPCKIIMLFTVFCRCFPEGCLCSLHNMKLSFETIPRKLLEWSMSNSSEFSWIFLWYLDYIHSYNEIKDSNHFHRDKRFKYICILFTKISSVVFIKHIRWVKYCKYFVIKQIKCSFMQHSLQSHLWSGLLSH